MIAELTPCSGENPAVSIRPSERRKYDHGVGIHTPRHIEQAVAAAALRRVGSRPSAAPAVTAPIVAFVVPPHAGRGRRPVHCVRRSSPLHSEAPSITAAWVWRVAPRVRLRRFVLGVPHPRLRFLRIFGWLSKVRKLPLKSTLQKESQPRRRTQGSFGPRKSPVAGVVDDRDDGFPWRCGVWFRG
jgi:hypothetical protein